MKPSPLAVGALFLVPTLAFAQPGVQKPQPKPTPTFQTPPPLPPYQSLVRRDEGGRVVRLTGCLDALALEHNPLIDQETRDRIGPVVKDWTADLNKLAIDNVDLIERLDAGLLEHTNPNDVHAAKIVQSVISQLSSAGQLTGRLLQSHAIELRPAQLNMQISNEYVQAIAMDYAKNPTPVDPGLPAAEQQAKQVANAQAVNRWYQSLSMRDACEQYRRILVDSAPMLDQILPALSLSTEGEAKIKAKASAVHSASTEVDKLVAVRSLLDDLSFDQRRAYLAKAVALGAAPDPFHPAPDFPTRTGATAAAAAPAPAGITATHPSK
jgi:hypothetical protein